MALERGIVAFDSDDRIVLQLIAERLAAIGEAVRRIADVLERREQADNP